MNEIDRLRQRAMFNLVAVVALLAITVPVGALSALHRASAEAAHDGGPLEVASLTFAWPVYVVVVVAIGWSLAAISMWTAADDKDRANKPSPS